MPQTRWTGEFTDGRSAALHAVGVDFDGLYLRILDAAGQEIARFTVQELHIDRLDGARGIEIGVRDRNTASLRLFGASVAEELAAIGVARSSLPPPGARRAAMGVGLLLGIIALTALVWNGVSPLSRVIARQIPLETERALNGQLDDTLGDWYCDDATVRGLFDEVMDRLLASGHGYPSVRVLNVEAPNAFAMPGGQILFTRGLLSAAESPDEVAGVLAHEIQHVEQRHVMTSVVRGALLSFVWAVTVGDYTGLLVIDPATTFQIATLSFSREDEASADAGAMRMLDRAGIRRDGLSNFFARLDENSGAIPEWLSTHPDSAWRASEIGHTRDPDVTTTPALDPAKWEQLKAACSDASAPAGELSDVFFGV